MILDRIENAGLYVNLHPRFARAFEHVRGLDVESAQTGRYELDETMYVMIQEYETKLKEKGFWESHRRYIDLQYVARGAEEVGYANLRDLQPGEYNPEKDFLPHSGTGSPVILKSGYFMLLFPEDVHMPGLAVGEPAPLKKIVVKIAV